MPARVYPSWLSLMLTRGARLVLVLFLIWNTWVSIQHSPFAQPRQNISPNWPISYLSGLILSTPMCTEIMVRPKWFLFFSRAPSRHHNTLGGAESERSLLNVTLPCSVLTMGTTGSALVSVA